VAWWIWIGAGIVLALIELLAGGELWLLFAGVAAIVVGLLAGVGMTDVAAQFLVFSLLAVSAFFVRRRLTRPGDTAKVGSESLVGEIGPATSTILPATPGHAEFRGSSWPARSATGHPIEAGTVVRVVRMEGITLFVEPE
jgi:membrane protein implicated in regulation of membrane protease activity